MFLLSNDDIHHLMSVKDCMAAQEAAFADLPSGRSIQRPRIDVYAPAERQDAYYRWSSMEGVTVRPGPYFATRIKSDVVYWPRSADGRVTEQKYCGKPGLYCGLVMVFSTRDGRPLAMINDGVLQHMRVGAGAGIGARYLARDDAGTVGILGSGGMARVYLEAFAAIRNIRHAKVFSPTSANRETFAREMSEQLHIDVQPVASAEQAVRGSHIVASCTDSMTPTIDAAWLEPGMHVTNVGPAEIDRACYERFDVVFRQGDAGNSAEALTDNPRLMREVGQSPIAYVAGTDEEMRRLPPAENKVRTGFGGAFPHVVDLITGVRAGRTDAKQITFYHNFGHQGLQFAAVGGLAYERAVAAGRGRKLPDEWFLQDVRN